MAVQPVVASLTDLALRVSALKQGPVLIKFGGSVQDDPAQTRAIMRDVASLAALGLRPVVVHGGGKAVTSAMSQAGIKATFVNGQRVTDPQTLRVAERVLCGEINPSLVNILQQFGCAATGLTSLGSCVLSARRVSEPMDLGLVGRVERVHVEVIRAMVKAKTVPVIAPVALDLDGSGQGSEPQSSTHVSSIGKLNVNADLAAGVLARYLQPSAFILISDTAGIRTDPSSFDSHAASLSRKNVAELIASKVIDGGMIPKVEATNMALAAGVSLVRITDGRESEGLLAAVLTDTFPGTDMLP